MFHYSVTEWLLLFYFYCFFGWCFESTYVSLRTGHWVNRGFMKAPFLPLYGSGAILILVVTRPFADNIVLTYIAGCIGATLLELATGAGMEALYKIKYWDYSNQRFNFQGHICLSSTIAWGFLSILMTSVVHEPVATILLGLPEVIKYAIVLTLTVWLSWDFALSFKEAMAMRRVLMQLQEAEKFEDIQAELTARYEVHISKQVRVGEV